jgi:hypothetical protein
MCTSASGVIFEVANQFKQAFLYVFLQSQILGHAGFPEMSRSDLQQMRLDIQRQNPQSNYIHALAVALLPDPLGCGLNMNVFVSI